MCSFKVLGICLVVVFIPIITQAQKCMDRPCGKLECPMIEATGCPIKAQEDCDEFEVYLEPGQLCECCGACLSRELMQGETCLHEVMDQHTLGCAVTLCCSNNKVCVEKTSEYGAP